MAKNDPEDIKVDRLSSGKLPERKTMGLKTDQRGHSKSYRVLAAALL